MAIEMLVPARGPLRQYFLGFLMRLCSECGLDMDLVGLRHRCVPLPRGGFVTKPVTEPVTKPADVTKPKGRGGRPLVGDQVMTVAERVARHRARKRGVRWRTG